MQVFDWTRDMEDIIHWWQGVEKYFSLAKITDPKDKFEAVPTFLATKEPLLTLWTELRKAVALVKTNLGTRQWLPVGDSLDMTFQQATLRFFYHLISEESSKDQHGYLQYKIKKPYVLQLWDLIAQLEQLNCYLDFSPKKDRDL